MKVREYNIYREDKGIQILVEGDVMAYEAYYIFFIPV